MLFVIWQDFMEIGLTRIIKNKGIFIVSGFKVGLRGLLENTGCSVLPTAWLLTTLSEVNTLGVFMNASGRQLPGNGYRPCLFGLATKTDQNLTMWQSWHSSCWWDFLPTNSHIFYTMNICRFWLVHQRLWLICCTQRSRESKTVATPST